MQCNDPKYTLKICKEYLKESEDPSNAIQIIKLNRN